MVYLCKYRSKKWTIWHHNLNQLCKSILSLIAFLNYSCKIWIEKEIIRGFRLEIFESKHQHYKHYSVSVWRFLDIENVSNSLFTRRLRLSIQRLYNGYFKNHWTSTRLVCTYIDIFHATLISWYWIWHLAMTKWTSTVSWKVGNILICCCTRHPPVTIISIIGSPSILMKLLELDQRGVFSAIVPSTSPFSFSQRWYQHQWSSSSIEVEFWPFSPMSLDLCQLSGMIALLSELLKWQIMRLTS